LLCASKEAFIKTRPFQLKRRDAVRQIALEFSEKTLMQQEAEELLKVNLLFFISYYVLTYL